VALLHHSSIIVVPEPRNARHCLSLATVSRLFHETLDVITVQLEWLIKWPEREELWKTMQNCFRTCYRTKVVAIVDCYDTFSFSS